ncbi:MAG: mechanosensitive ion channel family protein, partial [Candidatus Krumholzibacteria bacterium]|nr:mechanosensitive ion channel family protein [Candidatus Krumholzibacteria bacterium]
MFHEFLDRVYLGNSARAYLVSLATFVGGVILLRIFSAIVVSRLKKFAEHTTTTLDDFIIQSLDSKILPLFYIGVLYLSLKELEVSAKVTKAIDILSLVIITIFAVRFILSFLMYMLDSYWAKREKDESKKKAMKGIVIVIKFVVWVSAGIILLDNLGIEISALIAGLGIGGIAIALAAQSILGDLFSYFTIFFDRPFEIGDFIVVGDFQGTVERVGIKTSRLRSLSGEEIVFSNTDLTNSRVRNYKRMERRRVLFKLSLTYDTTADQLREIPGIIERIVRENEGVEFDRSHFNGYGDFSLNIETVYFVLTRDYNTYMDIQQKINLG